MQNQKTIKTPSLVSIRLQQIVLDADERGHARIQRRVHTPARREKTVVEPVPEEVFDDNLRTYLENDLATRKPTRSLLLADPEE